MPHKIYWAETAAIERSPRVPRLDGTVQAAQRYTDKITSSSWWKMHCNASWIGSGDLSPTKERVGVPSRVLVIKAFTPTEDLAWMDPYTPHERRGKRYPAIFLTTKISYKNVPAIADPWTILHELAHVMTANVDQGHHHRDFCMAYLNLVRKYLGEAHWRALAEEMRLRKIRLNYRLILS